MAFLLLRHTSFRRHTPCICARRVLSLGCERDELCSCCARFAFNMKVCFGSFREFCTYAPTDPFFGGLEELRMMEVGHGWFGVGVFETPQPEPMWPALCQTKNAAAPPRERRLAKAEQFTEKLLHPRKGDDVFPARRVDDRDFHHAPGSRARERSAHPPPQAVLCDGSRVPWCLREYRREGCQG